MRALVLIATLLWGGVSWWWYTCDIKGYCEGDTVQVAANKKEEPTAIQPKDDKAKIELTEKTVSDGSKADVVNSADVASDVVKPDEITTDASDDAQEPVVAEDSVPSGDDTTDVASDAVKPDETTTGAPDDTQEPVVAEDAAPSEGDTVETALTDDSTGATPAENTATDAETSTVDTEGSSDAVQTDTTAQEQSNTDETAAIQTDTATDTTEEIVSEDDNDPKKIRIDIVSGASTANIKKARVYFPYSSSKTADLTGSATRYFDKVVEALKADSSLKVLLTGHTDSKGQAKRNQSLGLRRAETVKKIFIGKGVSAKQIKTDSKGENLPLSSNNSEAGRNKNRRVAVEVITE